MTDVIAVISLVASMSALIILIIFFIYFRKSYGQLNTSYTPNISNEINSVKESLIGISTNLQNIATVIGEIKGTSSNISSLLTTTGEIKGRTDDINEHVKKIREFTELMKGSSQKRGQAGEAFVRSYLGTLPRELWEEQFEIPGTNRERVDFALRINSDGGTLYLPIDSKFSLPSDNTDEADFIKTANDKALQRGKEIVKYIVPGVTTDFAVMVIPDSVYYALKDETITELSSIKIIPTPVEGIIILSNIALRAHQAIALQRGLVEVKELVDRTYRILDGMVDEMDDLEKKLRSAIKSLQNNKNSIVNERDNLDVIRNRISARDVSSEPEKK